VVSPCLSLREEFLDCQKGSLVHPTMRHIFEQRQSWFEAEISAKWWKWGRGGSSKWGKGEFLELLSQVCGFVSFAWRIDEGWELGMKMRLLIVIRELTASVSREQDHEQRLSL
jgi:hypothetical protein